MKLSVFALGLVLASTAFGQEPATVTNAAAVARSVEMREVDPAPHPTIPAQASWPGVMLIIVLLGFFGAAAVIGPIVRAEVPDEVPVAHTHDEPPGASHHHGASGTLNPDPPFHSERH